MLLMSKKTLNYRYPFIQRKYFVNVLLFLISSIPFSVYAQDNLITSFGSLFTLEDLKILIPAAITLFTLVVTNIVLIWKIGKDSRESIRRQLVLDDIIKKRKQLEKFYNPIHALIQTNAAVFKAFGPGRSRENQNLGEARKVWSHMVENVILTNNSKICTIILDCTDLLESEDKLENYLEFMRHAVSYEAFRKMPNELHRAFPYPNNFEKNVEYHRQKLLDELLKIEGPGKVSVRRIQ